MKPTERIEIHQSQIITFWTRLSKFLFPKRSAEMTDGGEKWKRQLAFDEESIVTGTHMTSCNKSSFSRQEREPLERDCWIIKFSDVPVMCNKYSQKKRSRYEMRNGYKACHISLLYFFVSLFSRTWRCITFNNIPVILVVFGFVFVVVGFHK